MDSKIILAILIVALIGIVAATYQNETNDVMSSLANVATENPAASESVTDLATASGDGANSVKVDESIVQPDSSVNSKVASTPKSSNNPQQASASQSSSNTNDRTSDSSNSGSSSNNNQANNNQNHPSNSGTNNNQNPSGNQGSSTGQDSQPTNNQNSQGQQSGISETEAMSIAKNSLPDGVTSDYQKVSETTINGKKYYEINLYKDGEIIAYSEIDSQGQITGGAIKGEAPAV